MEPAEGTAGAARLAVKAAGGKAAAEDRAAAEALAGSAVAMVKAAKAAVSAARAETVAASAALATRTVAEYVGEARAAEKRDALRRRSRCSRCRERRPSTPTQGRHPHRCRCRR